MSSFEQALKVIASEQDTNAIRELESLLKTELGLVRRVDEQGLTLLHHAAMQLKGELAVFLVGQGADPNACTLEGDTPLLLTAKGQSVLALHESVAREIGTWRRVLSDKAEAMYALAEAAERLMYEGKIEDALAMFKDHPELIHAWYPSHGQLLHWAAWRGRRIGPVVTHMLEHGADPNALGADQKTPLHKLMDRPYDQNGEILGILRLLVEHGADPNRRDKLGWTPLHAAAMSSNAEEAVRLLVESGAEINAELGGPGGETALDLVNEWRRRGLANWLKSKGATSKKEIRQNRLARKQKSRSA
jgi:ankyrin repeat protein